MKIILPDIGVDLSKPRSDIVAFPHYLPQWAQLPAQYNFTRGTIRKEQTIILCSIYIGPSISDMLNK